MKQVMVAFVFVCVCLCVMQGISCAPAAEPEPAPGSKYRPFSNLFGNFRKILENWRTAKETENFKTVYSVKLARNLRITTGRRITASPK